MTKKTIIRRGNPALVPERVGMVVPATEHFEFRNGFQILGSVVASVDVLRVIGEAGLTLGDVLGRHLANQTADIWDTDVFVPSGRYRYVHALTMTGGGITPTTYLSIDGEEVLPSGRRISAAFTFSFSEGASREEIARAGRRVVQDRFHRRMQEA